MTYTTERRSAAAKEAAEDSKKRNREEYHLCCRFNETLLMMRPQCGAPELEWIHIDNGQVAGGNRKARAIAGSMAKQMGTKPGFPDYQFFWRGADDRPRMGWLEMKVPGGKLTTCKYGGYCQTWWRDYALKLGVPWVVAYSIDEALTALREWGAWT